MKISLLGDVDWESRVDQVLDSLSDCGYRPYFEERDYGTGLAKLAVLLVCQSPNLNLKPRIRFSKTEKTIYMDILLDLHSLRAADMAARKHIVAERLVTDIPKILTKYKITNFDMTRFINDFRTWVIATGWINNDNRAGLN